MKKFLQFLLFASVVSVLSACLGDTKPPKDATAYMMGSPVGTEIGLMTEPALPHDNLSFDFEQGLWVNDPRRSIDSQILLDEYVRQMTEGDVTFQPLPELPPDTFTQPYNGLNGWYFN